MTTESYLIRDAICSRLFAGPTTFRNGGNKGNGTITLASVDPVVAGAKAGPYVINYNSATTFVVLDPDGVQIGSGSSGVAFATQIKFTTHLGTIPFQAGDMFVVWTGFAMGGFKTLRKTILPTLQQTDIPALSVYLIGERLGAEGSEWNQGDLHYLVDATIIVSVIRGLEDPLVLDGDMERDARAIDELLLQDGTFTYLGKGGLFEGIPSIVRTRLLPKIGEMYASELRTEMTFRFRTEFLPRAPFDFKLVHIDVKGPDGTTLVVREYDVT